jgi:hypothetical protein
MKKLVLGALAVAALSLGAHAQTLPAPQIKAGDQWTYQITVERAPNTWNKSENEVTVTRVTSSSIYLSSKQAGSTQPPRDSVVGADWSRIRDVNGKETLVNRPLAFPLEVGKSWEVSYTEQHPNKGHRFEEWHNKFTVVGYEPIDVPAGHFNALKVESEGHWNAELEPSNGVVQGAVVTQGNTTMVTQAQRVGAKPISGRTYKAFWYVPEVKRWVKSVEETYSVNDVRTERFTAELASFKPAASGAP